LLLQQIPLPTVLRPLVLKQPVRIEHLHSAHKQNQHINEQ
jgi:hypothetical protein